MRPIALLLFLFCTQLAVGKDSIKITRSAKPDRIEGLTWDQPLLQLGTKKEKVLIARGKFRAMGRTLTHQGKKLKLKKNGAFEIRTVATSELVQLTVIATGKKKPAVREQASFALSQKRQLPAPPSVSKAANREVATSTLEAPRNQTPVHLLFLPGMSYFKITSTDQVNGGQLTLTSQLVYGFSLEAKYGEEFPLLLGIRIQKVRLNSPIASPLENDNLTLLGLRLGAGFSPFTGNELFLSTGYLLESEPMVALSTSENLTIESASLHRLWARADFALVSSPTFLLVFQTELRTLLPKQTPTESFALGYEGFAGVEASLRQDSSRFLISVRQALQALNSNQTERRKLEASIHLGAEFRL